MSYLSLHHALTKRRGQIVCDGDSITAALDVALAERYPTVAASLINGGRCDYVNSGLGGTTLFQMGLSFAADVAPLYDSRRLFNIAVCAGGTNDLVGGSATTGAGLIARAQSWIASAEGAGFTVFVMTLLPRNMGGGPPDQTTFNTHRATYNAWVLANAPHVFDAGSIPEAQDYTDFDFYSDGTHPTSALLALMGQRLAGAVNTFLGAP